MTLSLERLVSFAAAGILSVGTYLLFHADLVLPAPSPLAVAMVAYAVVGAIAAGLAGRHVGPVFTGLWLVAVLLVLSMVVKSGPPPPGPFLALGVSLVFGTLAFGLWAASGAAFAVFLRGVKARSQQS